MPPASRDVPEIGYYDREFTTFYAAQSDPRFSYGLYVPRAYDPGQKKRYPLVVLVHGTERSPWDYRSRFAGFAERNGCILLTPLFPANTFGGYDLENYKYLACQGVRYDQVLLGMVDEVAVRYRLRDSRFCLFGFSGGGHFSHRFFYLHPERLTALSIGAPGIVTLLDDRYDFWVGVRDMEARFGKRLDIEAMRRVPVQMVIGAEDTETWEIGFDQDDELWMPGGELTGHLNRLQRMELLKQSFERAGIAVRHSVVQGVDHDTPGVLPAVRRFFTGVLRDARNA